MQLNLSEQTVIYLIIPKDIKETLKRVMFIRRGLSMVPILQVSEELVMCDCPLGHAGDNCEKTADISTPQEQKYEIFKQIYSYYIIMTKSDYKKSFDVLFLIRKPLI